MARLTLSVWGPFARLGVTRGTYYRGSCCGFQFIGDTREDVVERARSEFGKRLGVLYFPPGVRP